MSLQHPPERGPYELPEALQDEIFLQAIVPRVLLAREPERQDRPEVVLLGGQPGAGKTTASRMFQREFAGRGGIVAVGVVAGRDQHLRRDVESDAEGVDQVGRSDDVPPAEFEAAFYAVQQADPQGVGTQ